MHLTTARLVFTLRAATSSNLLPRAALGRGRGSCVSLDGDETARFVAFCSRPSLDVWFCVVSPLDDDDDRARLAATASLGYRIRWSFRPDCRRHFAYGAVAYTNWFDSSAASVRVPHLGNCT